MSSPRNPGVNLAQLKSDDFEVVRGLFPENYPNLAFVYADIAKTINSEVWVDNIEDPQSE
jgi:hypothetical protein